MHADAPTREEIREAFEATGLTVSSWAESRGFRRESVYAVLSGRTRGLRGEAHRIATALGLKFGPSARAAHFLAHAGEGQDHPLAKESE